VRLAEAQQVEAAVAEDSLRVIEMDSVVLEMDSVKGYLQGPARRW
jgi:hypothetical protein